MNRTAVPRVKPTKGGSKYSQKLVYPNGYVKYVRYPEQLPKNVTNPMDKQRIEQRQMNMVQQASEILKVARLIVTEDLGKWVWISHPHGNYEVHGGYKSKEAAMNAAGNHIGDNIHRTKWSYSGEYRGGTQTVMIVRSAELGNLGYKPEGHGEL